MCYFAYSAVNPEINRSDMESLTRGSEYHFRPGTKHDMKMAVAEDSGDFRLTDRCCDCEFGLCQGNPQAPELQALAVQLEKLRAVRGIKCVYLCKTWSGKRNKTEVTFHIDDLELPAFFAEMNTETLYRIDLYQRC